jgi:hypothetical protein
MFFRGQNKTEKIDLRVMYKKFMKSHILKRIPWVSSFVWEETSVQHLIVDVPVLHFSLHSSHIITCSLKCSFYLFISFISYF